MVSSDRRDLRKLRIYLTELLWKDLSRYLRMTGLVDALARLDDASDLTELLVRPVLTWRSRVGSRWCLHEDVAELHLHGDPQHMQYRG